MKTLLAALALTLFSVPSFAQERMGHESSGGRPFPYAVSIDFTSHGSGIDGSSYDATVAFISQGLGDGTIKVVMRKSMGREGEVSYCLEFADMDSASSGPDAIEKIIQDAHNASKPMATTRGHTHCDDTWLYGWEATHPTTTTPDPKPF